MKIPNKYYRVLPADHMIRLVTEIWNDTHPLGQMPKHWDQLIDSLDPDQVVMLKNSLVAIITISIQETKAVGKANGIAQQEKAKSIRDFKKADPLVFFGIKKCE